ncbi:hypothetical protein F5878DRAFT_545178, partial [Lentinula raphanica]
KDARLSKPAWMGVKASLDQRAEIETALNHSDPAKAKTMLRGVAILPYQPHLTTGVRDAAGRLFLLRSALTSSMTQDILPAVNATALEFVQAIKKPFTEADMEANLRGTHWFSIAGHDRNNKRAPAASRFQEENQETIERFFEKGSRYQESIDYMATKYGVHAKFDLFFNFCLNSSRQGVDRVFYLPIFTTTDGQHPTKENSKPLHFCGCSSHEGNQGWARGDGRGSLVWFNQASMVQTSEVGVCTLRLAKEQGLDTNCNIEGWLQREVFPML